MNTYSIDRLQPLTIGRVGDHGVTQIPIDCTAWLSKYPSLTTWYIQAVAPDGVLYMPSTTMEGDVLIWYISERDTTLPGYGEYWVIAEGEDGTKKTSASPPFIVLGEKRSTSTGGTGDSDPGSGGSCNCDTEALREEFNTLVADAESAATRAEDAADRAEDIADSVEDVSALTGDAAERAEIAADNAENSSGRAEAAASQANEAKVSAEASAESARESAELAQGSTGGLSNVLVIHGGGAVFPDK